jgi:hypothetical protein
MARDKTMTLHIDEDQLAELVAVLQRYAHAAWPPGGSECAQASRDALITATEAMREGYTEHPGEAQFNRRQRATFRTALEYHLEQPEFQVHHELYTELLRQLSTTR